ncbi:ribonuclease H-like domain-containing protein [Abortiporus biennis]|nr:ribonuclease H-like domain-containing protein [Abortiporus biennis]
MAIERFLNCKTWSWGKSVRIKIMMFPLHRGLPWADEVAGALWPMRRISLINRAKAGFRFRKEENSWNPFEFLMLFSILKFECCVEVVDVVGVKIIRVRPRKTYSYESRVKYCEDKFSRGGSPAIKECLKKIHNCLHIKDLSCQPTSKPFEIPQEEYKVFNNRSCINNGDENAKACSGIWYGPNDPKNQALRVPTHPLVPQTNQSGELYAILKTIKQSTPFVPLHIVTESKYCLDGLTKFYKKWEERGWIQVANSALFRATLSWTRTRSAITTLRWVKGHQDTAGNIGADEEVGKGAGKNNTEDPHMLEIAPKLNLTGAQLSTITQSLAYRAIRTEKKQSHLMTRGKWWDNITNMEHRGLCPKCKVEESMNHILTDCDALGQKIIWKLAEKLWRKRDQRWSKISTGIILACNLNEFKNRKGKISLGLNRLYRIPMSESAHLIWVLIYEH